MIQEFDLPTFDSTSYEDVHWEDVSQYRKSEAWKHFMYDRKYKIAKCNYCGNILRSHGSTKTLQRHLKTHDNDNANASSIISKPE